MRLRVPKIEDVQSAASNGSAINVLDDYVAIKLKVERSRTDCCGSLPGGVLMLRNRSRVASLIGLDAAVASTLKLLVVACVKGVRTQRLYAKLWKTRRLGVVLASSWRRLGVVLASSEAVDFEVARGNVMVEDWASRSEAGLS
ncbi:MAG: hypothetical protein ACKFI0_00490 [Candidatus Hodgkinia cicadicola]